MLTPSPVLLSKTDRERDGRTDRQTDRQTSSKKAHYKRLKKLLWRKKETEREFSVFPSWFSNPGFPVPVFPSRFSRPGFPVPVFREQILENKFFVSDFGRKKLKFPVLVSKTGTGKLGCLVDREVLGSIPARGKLFSINCSFSFCVCTSVYSLRWFRFGAFVSEWFQ